MYIGRFVVLGKTAANQWYLGYRVSSRSFPNRVIRLLEDRAVVVPTADAPPSNNPYISYNCLRRQGEVTVVANGSHVDPTIDKIGLGYPLRDAMALALLAMDYEHDAYNTPRIVAGVDARSDQGLLGIVGAEQIMVCSLAPDPGEALLVATYECTTPTAVTLAGKTAAELCNALYDCEYELPVAVMVALLGPEGVMLAARSARD
jgi:IMP cyclohydrolase